MKTQSIDYIVSKANSYLETNPGLRKGQSLYLATYNYLKDYGTAKERENFDTLIPHTSKDCFFFDYRINAFIRTLENCI